VLHSLLEKPLRLAVLAVLPDAEVSSVVVRPCADPKFGDYQTTSLMALAKTRKMNPRQLAAQVMDKLDVREWCESVEMAGAGFLNFRLKPDVLAQTLRKAAQGKHLFFQTTPQPRTIVVDFSSPNVAKPMHVGHIRSTILGDCLARTLRLLGHQVITDNHIGDWGTQFGKLLVGWKRQLDPQALKRDPLGEMERLYKSVNAACQHDPSLLEEARQELVRLQNGHAENIEIWKRMIDLSQHQFDAIYRRLDVNFNHVLGESFYNSRLKSVVEDLKEKGLARESEGATVVFFDDRPALKDHPAIVQKSDGAANYTTTDLATLAYRLETWRPQEIVYVTDSRQQLHFQQLFAIFNRWHPEASLKLAHVWFGTILGEDGKPFRTREGDVVKLSDLLDEAEERAYRLVSEKNPELDETKRRGIARVVGVGAVKYADLLPNRQSDYTFNWDRMLALSGNTAPYLQYAYTRIRGIRRKLDAPWDPSNAEVILREPEEMALGRHLLQFGLVLEAVAEEYRPNYLCNFLYDLAGIFTRFYEACPVLKSEEPTRSSRLVLCELTGNVLKQGLSVLGIETLDRM
jgi:arginyl-tRNA synthetase